MVLVAVQPVAAPAEVTQQRPVASQPAAPGSDSACQGSLFEVGCRHLEAGNATAAVRVLERAAAKYPARIDYALKLAEAYAASNQPEAAERLLTNLRALHPTDMATALALARNRARRGAWPAVVGMLRPVERRLGASGVLLLAEGLRRTGEESGSTAALRRGLERFPNDESLWLALIDILLGHGSYALAQQRIAEAQRRIGPSPQLHFRAAQAHFHLGEALGATTIREVPGGRTGQFSGRWLLVEERAEPQRFLCCPADSALYQLRRALDAGLDEPDAHILHALIWQRAGRPAVGYAILKAREAVLLESADSATLTTFAHLALEAGALSDFLRYARRQADRQPERRSQIMAEAYLSVAERYNERGDSASYAAFLRRALRLQPDNADMILRLADADWAAERRNEAVLGYRRVLERGPGPAERGRILERLAAWQASRADSP
jgi:tetratricopeptide (TPR) repeat protein